MRILASQWQVCHLKKQSREWANQFGTSQGLENPTRSFNTPPIKKNHESSLS